MIEQFTYWFRLIPDWILTTIWLVVVSVLLLTFFALFAGPVSWLERRIAGRIMSRIGPNRVGPQGVIQWLADGLKNFLKEDLIPASADKLLFRFAPYPVFVGVTMTLVTLPFSSHLIGADLNVGLIYIVGAWGLVVVGLLAAGWASNSKWTLIGGMRSAAQMVSYEIPLVTSLLVPVLLAGSLSFQTIISSQGWRPIDWFVFSNPFAAVAFLIAFIAAVAESNRTPFDIPEAESELVNGYNTEYSGMRFLFFFFAEWGNIYVISALLAALFFGGWQAPPSWKVFAARYGSILPHVLEAVVFQVKAWAFVLLIIQLRWTLPRLRVDQLMKLSWKYLLPFAFVTVIGNAVWMVLLPSGLLFVKYLLFISAVALFGYFVWRVFWQLRWTKSKVDIKFNM